MSASTGEEAVGDNDDMEAEDEVPKCSSGGEEGGVRVLMMGHCVICLRKTSDDKKVSKLRKYCATRKESKCDQVEVVPTPTFEDDSVSLSSLLKCLNWIWGYIIEKDGGGKLGDPLKNSGILSSKSVENDGDEVVFSHLPEMCHFCVERLTSVDKMMRELLKMVDKLGGIAREAKCGGGCSWRGQKFLKILKGSGMENGSILKTLEILNLQEGSDDNQEMEGAEVKREPAEGADISSESDDDDHGVKLEPSQLVHVKLEAEDSEEEQPTGQQCSFRVNNIPDYSKPEVGIEDSDDSSSIDSSEDDSDGDSDDDKIVKRWKPQQRKRKRGMTIIPRKTTVVQSSSGTIIVSYNANRQQQRLPLIRQKSMTGVNATYSKQKCDLCKVIVPIKKLHKHYQEHIGLDYMLNCPNQACSSIFGTPWFLYDHLIKSKSCGDCVPDPNEYKTPIRVCEVCGFETGTALKLRRHLLQDHENDTKNYSCPVKNCDERFTVKQSVVLHLPHHEFCRDVTSQRCDQCNKQIKLEEMADHLKDNHQVEDVIKCNQCSFLFSTRQSLIDHMFQHRFSVLSCDICNDGVNYGQHSKLRDHYFLKHQIGQKHPCGICDHMCWTKEGLITHRKEHHNDKPSRPQKMYKCDECDAEFARPVSVQDHKIVFHGAEPLKCKFCGEKFTRRLLYQKHIKEHRGIPTDERYPCEWEGCTKIFATKRGREYHVAAGHIGEKSYHCDICDKSFAVPAGLWSHKNTAHSDVRPHVCDVCGESFKLLATLKTHKLIHTGERPFACEFCGQRFRQKVALSTHLKGHQEKGDDFKPNGPMKNIRKRVDKSTTPGML